MEEHSPKRRAFTLGLLAAAASPVVARAQKPAPASPWRDLYMYQGADRDAKLLAGAKKEGRLSMYTSLNLKDSVPITEAFEKKHGVKVEIWRSSSEKVLQRAVTEARAGRFTCDIIETNGPEMEGCYREQLLDEFFSPYFKDLPPAAFPKHRHYVADRFNMFTIAYNTNLVKPNEVPNAYEDLLDKRWDGRIALEQGDVDWFAAMVKHMGEEKGLAFFRKLAQNRPQIHTGHTLMGELIGSGEIPLAAAIYNHNVERLKDKGAPVEWKALQPAFGRPNAIGVARHAQRPHAGLLFADFMLSPEGQQLIKKRHRVPSSRAVKTPLNDFPYEMIDPVIVLDEEAKWEKIWTDLFLKGQKIRKGND
jgi:iron(III) transport system substrate-binding protein